MLTRLGICSEVQLKVFCIVLSCMCTGFILCYAWCIWYQTSGFRLINDMFVDELQF